MMKRYDQLKKIVAFIKPKTIIEVGTHNGARAEMLCREARKYRDNVHYLGFDLFDGATEDTNVQEFNGKGYGSEEKARARLGNIDGVEFELIKGNTRETLHGTNRTADLVFIDGGHSVHTIAGDYQALKNSRCIVFDDYYTNRKERFLDKFGCNRVLENCSNGTVEILPDGDNGIKLATIGYSSKWEAAVKRIVDKEGHESVAVWHGIETPEADFLCAVDGLLERAQDVDALLGDLRKAARKRLFFSIKADFRSLEWWNDKLKQYFQILEWFCPDGREVAGTGMPLFAVGEWESRGVLDDNKRFDQVAENVKVISKRLKHGEPNNRRAAIVCYGPSLKETWPELLAEIKFAGADIISVSGAHDYILRRGIVPNFHVECDPRPHKALNLEAPQKEKTQYLIASCCHPNLINKLDGCDITLWHLCNGHDSFRILEEIESEKDQFLLAGGGSVGLRAIGVMYALGYRDFSIYGMDCSFTNGMSKTEFDKINNDDLMQWAGRHKGKRQPVIDVMCDDKWFKTSPVLVTYARHFATTLECAKDAKFALHGGGLLQEMYRKDEKSEAA